MTIEWDNREGETPYEDLDGFKLIDEYPYPTRQLVDELEEENIRKATVKYLSSRPSGKKAPFKFKWLLKLHEEMYGDVWEWAGTTRQQNTQIGVDKHQINEQLRILAFDIPDMPTYFDDPVEIAASIHHRAVYIHPFKNGNGRWSRLLANIWLKQNHNTVTKWPSIAGESPVRDEYLKAVREADGLDFSRFIEMHHRYTELDSQG